MNSSLGYYELSTTNNTINNVQNNTNTNNNNNNNGNGTEIDKKRNARKTIKNRTNIQKMIKTIYDPVNDDYNNDMGDFPPNAELTKVPQVDYNSELLNNNNNNNNNNDNNINPIINSNLGNQNEDNINNNNNNNDDGGINTSEGFNSLPNTYAKDYYKQYVPYYNQMSQNSGNKDQLLEKLNYMIHLLEEQQDVKTGHVMEEIILYSFLGIFMIFVVDSFARAAKYVR